MSSGVGWVEMRGDEMSVTVEDMERVWRLGNGVKLGGGVRCILNFW